MNKKGLIYALISATAFSLGGLFAKLIPWSAISISSGRCIFSSLFFLIYFISNKKEVKINKTTIFGAICVSLNMITYILANKLTTAANTAILEYTAPIYIIIFSMIFKKKKPSLLEILTVIFVIIGICLIMADGIGGGNMLGNIIAMIDGVIYAVVIMLNEFEDGDSLSSMLIGHLITLFVGLPFIFRETAFDPGTIIRLVFMGVIQTGVGYWMLSLSGKYADALTVSLVSYVEPVLNPIWVFIFYEESISLISIAGIVIVLTTIVIYTIKSRK